MEACDGDSSCDTSGIDIALEMVTADDAAFAHLISAFEDFVLALRVDFGKNQRCRQPMDVWPEGYDPLVESSSCCSGLQVSSE